MGLGPKLNLANSTTGTLLPAQGGTGVVNNNASTLTINGSYPLSLTLSGSTSLALPASGTLATTSNNLSVFSSTTSAQLASIISDETGSGALVFGTAPTITNANLVTPSLGIATASKINKVTITSPATGATLSLADGKTLAVSNTLNLSGTDNASVVFGAGGNVVYDNVTTLSSLVSLGTITTGVWEGTKVGLPYGGTNADLSATGGTGQYLKQNSVGADITVSAVADSELTFTDITTNNVSTIKHGFAPKLPNDATKYLDGTGTYSIPPKGMVQIGGTQTASSSATIDFTSGIDNTYAHYIIEISNLVPSTGAQLQALLYQGGSFVTGSNYYYGINGVDSFGSTSPVGGNAQTSMQISTVSLATNHPSSFIIHLFQPNLITGTSLFWTGIVSTGAALIMTCTGGGTYNSVVATSGIRFQPSSGNFTTGIFKLYGVA